MDKNGFRLKENMLKAPVNATFKMNGYWICCGSVVKGEDDKYYMIDLNNFKEQTFILTIKL